MIHQQGKCHWLKEFLLGFFGALICTGIVLGLYLILQALF